MLKKLPGLLAISTAIGAVHGASAMPSTEASAAGTPDVAVVPGQEEAAVRRLLAKYDVAGQPGVAVGVYHRGKIVLTQTVGYADLENDVKLTRQTRFELASVSKQFTGYAIAQLALSGKLDLDADVHRYLPWLPAFGGAKITTRQLVYHTSGIRENTELCGLAGFDCRRMFNQQATIALLKRQKELNFAPGTHYSYSNTGYMLLGEIVHAVSGMTMRQYADTAIFKPLGMTSFYRDDFKEVIPGLGQSYTEDPSGKRPWDHWFFTSDLTGGSGVYASIDDMMKWVANYSRLSASQAPVYKMITTPGMLANKQKMTYGFGLDMADFAGNRQIAHTGNIGGYSNRLAYLPDHDLGIVVLTLRGGFDVMDIYDKVLRIYLGDKAITAPGEAITTVDPKVAKTLAGYFLLPDESWSGEVVPDELVHISSANGEFHIDSLDSELEGGPARSKLVFRKDGTFSDDEHADNWYRPVVKDGQVVALDKLVPLLPETRLRYARISPVSPTPEKNADYEGRYCSDELDACYTIRRDGVNLVAESIASTSEDPIVLRSQIPDRFYAPNWFFLKADFVRQDGKVTGMKVGSFRAINSYFAKR